MFFIETKERSSDRLALALGIPAFISLAWTTAASRMRRPSASTQPSPSTSRPVPVVTLPATHAAKLSARFLANIFDALIPMTLFFPVAAMIFLVFYIGSRRKGVNFEDYAPSGGTWVTLAFIAVGMILSLVSLELIVGTTPGKYVLGMRVVRHDGRRVTFPVAFSRALYKWSFATLGIITIIGYVAIVLYAIADRQNRFVWDRAADTMVVSVRH
ncbi:RDD family protein [Streptomyces aurantiacus]|uniref:RDD family protein n=1 Tax=Streptomyces aurantiacus TaxID=47760 RepID=UPI0012FE8C4D|nr:RDD family protein [Streptomyces aurantiacus]